MGIHLLGRDQEASEYGTNAPATEHGTRVVAEQATAINPGGSWCQFCGPAAVDYNNKRYLGWNAQDGSIMVSQIDLKTGAIVTSNLHTAFVAGGGANDHVSPSLVVRPDGRIIAMYAQQGANVIYQRTTTAGEDITAWGAEVATTTEQAQYPRPHYIGSRLFLIYSGSPQWRIRYSDDHGVTWSGAKNMIDLSPNPGGYIQTRDTAVGIDFIFSMHPNSSGAGYTAQSSMYHGYFDGTTFRKTDGTAVTTLAALPAYDPVLHPAGTIDPTTLTKVYDYTANGVCWALDVARDASGNPVAVFVSYPQVALGDTWTAQPSHFIDHRYNYYKWNGTAWVGGQVTTSVKMTAAVGLDLAEYVYTGGMNLVQSDPSIVYLSRPEAAQQQFEIERWVTPDGGTTWNTTAVTTDSPARRAKIRPLTPTHQAPGSPDAVWMDGYYYNYTSFITKIQLGSNPINRLADALARRPPSAGQVDPLYAATLAAAPALLLPLANDISDASGNANRVVLHADPTWTAGRLAGRTALVFDGSTQSIKTGLQPFAAGAVLTFFGWAKRTNHSAGHSLFGGDGGTASPGLRLNSGGQNIQFWANVGASGGAGSVNWASAWPGDGSWHHWALIADMTAQTVELYLDGVSLGVTAYTTNWGDASSYLVFGQDRSFKTTNPTDAFNGAMSLVGYYAGRLSATQIAGMAGVVTGDIAGNAALSSLIGRLATAGLVLDKTSGGPNAPSVPSSVTVGGGAGTGATVTLRTNSTDVTGQIMLTTGTGTSAGTVANLVFGTAFTGLHPLVLVQLEWTTGITTHTVKAVSVLATGFSVYCGNALPVSSAVNITYRVIGAI